jgi:hypothetical protein
MEYGKVITMLYLQVRPKEMWISLLDNGET